MKKINIRPRGQHQLTQFFTQKENDVNGVCFTDSLQMTMRPLKLMMIFMKEFLNTTAPADKILQSRDVGFREAEPIIQDVVNKIVKLREEKSFDRILELAKNLIPEDDSTKVIETRLKRNVRRPDKFENFILTDLIGERSDTLVNIKSAYFGVIDLFQSEMAQRFDNKNQILLAISEAGEFSIEKLKPLEQLGLELPSTEELAVAKSFIDRKKDEHDKQRQTNNDNQFKTRFNMLKELYNMREAFPSVYKLMASVDTFGCSTTVCECSFSALDRIGTAPRINMDNERLRNLTFLAFENKRLSQITPDMILKKFDSNPTRRIQLY